MECPNCRIKMVCTSDQSHELWKCGYCGYKHSRYVLRVTGTVSHTLSSLSFGSEWKFIYASHQPAATPVGRTMDGIVERCKDLSCTYESPWIYGACEVKAIGHQRVVELMCADPLDVVIDGVTLRDLVELRECIDRERDIGAIIPWKNADPWTWTPAQRAAVSAHWSAQLRARVAASATADAERDRLQVVMEHDEL